MKEKTGANWKNIELVLDCLETGSKFAKVISIITKVNENSAGTLTAQKNGCPDKSTARDFFFWYSSCFYFFLDVLYILYINQSVGHLHVPCGILIQ